MRKRTPEYFEKRLYDIARTILQDGEPQAVDIGQAYVFTPVGNDALYHPLNLSIGDIVIVTDTSDIGICSVRRLDTGESLGHISTNSLTLAS